jgi:hypothetical protein
MNIPLFPREEFDTAMANAGLPSSGFIYNDYRSFVVNTYCPVKRKAPTVQKIAETSVSVSYPEVHNGIPGITTDTATMEIFKIVA